MLPKEETLDLCLILVFYNILCYEYDDKDR